MSCKFLIVLILLSINNEPFYRAVGSSDTMIRMFENSEMANTLATLEGHTASIKSLAFDPSSHFLASSAEDGTCRIWDAKSFKCLKTINCMSQDDMDSL
jgi:WD40 repeat protein